MAQTARQEAKKLSGSPYGALRSTAYHELTAAAIWLPTTAATASRFSAAVPVVSSVGTPYATDAGFGTANVPWTNPSAPYEVASLTFAGSGLDDPRRDNMYVAGVGVAVSLNVKIGCSPVMIRVGP